MALYLLCANVLVSACALSVQAPPPPEDNAATVRGGILAGPTVALPYAPGVVAAEEMGLGKTVELVATILSNRFKPSEVQSS
eukprot:245078-Pelagomonas_calceolata.AAC.3